MAFNVNCCDVVKYCERTWVRVLCMLFVCCLNYFNFNDMHDYVE